MKKIVALMLALILMLPAFSFAVAEDLTVEEIIAQAQTMTNEELYKKAIEELEHNTGHTYEELYIVGGGAKNQFLNRLTEEATGKKVIALPIEATALGNLNIQVND